MNKYVILSEKSWHKKLFENLKKQLINDQLIHIQDKSDFNIENLNRINPIKIFIPHWSYIIPSNIYQNYECIVFHMTDLPYGRGGSPLQNLIARGHETTKISAIRVDAGIDTGDLYLKKSLKLKGTAREIFITASRVIEKMIIEILKKNIKQRPQKGEIVEFKRRKPEDGNLINLNEIKLIFDYIRMLDCDGYPRAFIENNQIKIEFYKAKLDTNKNIIASVRIFKK